MDDLPDGSGGFDLEQCTPGPDDTPTERFVLQCACTLAKRGVFDEAEVLTDSVLAVLPVWRDHVTPTTPRLIRDNIELLASAADAMRTILTRHGFIP